MRLQYVQKLRQHVRQQYEVFLVPVHYDGAAYHGEALCSERARTCWPVEHEVWEVQERACACLQLGEDVLTRMEDLQRLDESVDILEDGAALMRKKGEITYTHVAKACGLLVILQGWSKGSPSLWAVEHFREGVGELAGGLWELVQSSAGRTALLQELRKHRSSAQAPRGSWGVLVEVSGERMLLLSTAWRTDPGGPVWGRAVVEAPVEVLEMLAHWGVASFLTERASAEELETALTLWDSSGEGVLRDADEAVRAGRLV